MNKEYAWEAIKAAVLGDKEKALFFQSKIHEEGYSIWYHDREAGTVSNGTTVMSIEEHRQRIKMHEKYGIKWMTIDFKDAC